MAVEAEQARAAARWMQQVEQRSDRRRLARAVRAEKAEDLARQDRQGDVLDAARAAVALGQASVSRMSDVLIITLR